MKSLILKIISVLALAGTIVPSVLVFLGIMDLQTNKTMMAVAMLVWFVTAPMWINKNQSA